MTVSDRQEIARESYLAVVVTMRDDRAEAPALPNATGAD